MLEIISLVLTAFALLIRIVDKLNKLDNLEI